MVFVKRATLPRRRMLETMWVESRRWLLVERPSFWIAESLMWSKSPRISFISGSFAASLLRNSTRERTGQGALFIADIQCIAPPDVKAEGVQGLLIAQIVPFLQEAEAQKTGNTEVGPTGLPVQVCLVIFFPKEDEKYLLSEQVSP
jgi:hypothetical protein